MTSSKHYPCSVPIQDTTPKHHRHRFTINHATKIEDIRLQIKIESIYLYKRVERERERIKNNKKLIN